eukprot:3713529-Rhodomonas_salina.1
MNPKVVPYAATMITLLAAKIPTLVFRSRPITLRDHQGRADDMRIGEECNSCEVAVRCKG